MAEDYPFGVEELNKELGDEFEPGEGLNGDDFEEIKTEGLPRQPSFPIITLTFAVLIDAIKLISGGFLGILAAILGFILVRVYLFGKMGFIKRFVYRKVVAAAVKNVIPVVGAFLGSWTWLIFRAHGKQKKRANQILTAVEKLLTPKHLERFLE